MREAFEKFVVPEERFHRALLALRPIRLLSTHHRGGLEIEPASFAATFTCLPVPSHKKCACAPGRDTRSNHAIGAPAHPRPVGRGNMPAHLVVLDALAERVKGRATAYKPAVLSIR